VGTRRRSTQSSTSGTKPTARTTRCKTAPKRRWTWTDCESSSPSQSGRCLGHHRSPVCGGIVSHNRFIIYYEWTFTAFARDMHPFQRTHHRVDRCSQRMTTTHCALSQASSAALTYFASSGFGHRPNLVLHTAYQSRRLRSTCLGIHLPWPPICLAPARTNRAPPPGRVVHFNRRVSEQSRIIYFGLQQCRHEKKEGFERGPSAGSPCMMLLAGQQLGSLQFLGLAFFEWLCAGHHQAIHGGGRVNFNSCTNRLIHLRLEILHVCHG